mmetsp:Transcript_38700/g.109717  ORF Transcript_38700/g.109717 Transcript_38700/m.109717 type:complete len:248 (-) Transcript_38700:129-872(-)
MRQRVAQPIHSMGELELSQLACPMFAEQAVHLDELVHLCLGEALALPDRVQQLADILEDDAQHDARRAQIPDAFLDHVVRDGVAEALEELRQLLLGQSAPTIDVELREERPQVGQLVLQAPAHHHEELAPAEVGVVVLVELADDVLRLVDGGRRAEPAQGAGQLVRGHLPGSVGVVPVEDFHEVLGLALREAVPLVQDAQRLLELVHLDLAGLVQVHLPEDVLDGGVRHGEAQVPQQVPELADADGA